MGFIERLRKEKNTKDAKYQKELADARARIETEDNQRKQAERNLQVSLERSKSFFHQAEIEGLVKRLNAIDCYVEFGYPNKKDYMNGRIQDCEYQDGTYRRWVITYHDNSTYTSMQTFFGIIVDCEGTIKFNGSPLFGTSKISQLQWKNDKGVLEEAMGKAYRHPQKETWSHSASVETPIRQ